jgi:CRP-like cAMP-binding protein
VNLLPRSLRQHETLQRKRTGELLFREGSDPAGIWVLHSGKVDLLFSTSKGYPKPLRLAEAPDALGVSDVLSGQQHDCSAITHTPCLVGFIDKERLLATLSEEPTTWFGVLQVLGDELNSCYDCLRLIRAGVASDPRRPVKVNRPSLNPT